MDAGKPCIIWPQNSSRPLLVSGLENEKTGSVEIHVTSDLRNNTMGVLSWTVSDMRGENIISGHKGIDIPGCRNILAHTLDLRAELDKYTPRDLIVWFELKNHNDEVISENMVTFAKPKHLNLMPDPKISASIKTDTNVFVVTLRSKNPALYVWLELRDSDAKYSDNFIALHPDKSAEIRVTPKLPMSLERFEQSLFIRSLVDLS